MRRLTFFLAATFLASATHAQINESTSLAEVEFSQLSQRDPGALGEKALSIHPEQWKHGETDHFIFHFAHSYVATPVSVEAEFHYRVIAQELDRTRPAGDIKSHIYIFERPEDWQQFQGLGELEKWTGGIHAGGSLFIVRDPRYKFSGNVLGHEIVHLVLNRFYPDTVPCWLNEGLAQFISKGACASFERARGYVARPHSIAIPPSEYIPLAALIKYTKVPNDRVGTFYQEAERLVRFLAEDDRRSFLDFVDAVSRHQAFETALSRSFGARFLNITAFEEKFRDYASKNFGTTVSQQASAH